MNIYDWKGVSSNLYAIEFVKQNYYSRMKPADWNNYKPYESSHFKFIKIIKWLMLI